MLSPLFWLSSSPFLPSPLGGGVVFMGVPSQGAWLM